MTDAKPQQCRRCFGRGYVGRWRRQRFGPKWKLEACAGCGGSGQRVYQRKERKADAS